MKLYALCDQDLLNAHEMSLEEFIRRAKDANAEIIQYRNKNANTAYIKTQLIRIRKLFDGFLIVNDAYELIEFCDGVHLGQEDLKNIDSELSTAVKIVRSVIGRDKIFGISTHNEEEIIEANTFDLNYIGLGAYRATNTKKDIDGILGDSLDVLAGKSKHLVAAIGGVKWNDLFQNVTYHVIGSGLINR
ncbi:thiamine phosphate synthase [Sulfurimonas sp. SAG-AH-194-I05]|nr:thiamine phosphate synthase [Sulfurimonas sp. SAG-AH-194-I05]MDF1875862.1 thiamine phosphate synthase [Sulfurimonas sp. SAG-AH-194-I05]